MAPTSELCALLDPTGPLLPFDGFVELFGGRWGVDPDRVRRVLLGASPPSELPVDCATALIDHLVTRERSDGSVPWPSAVLSASGLTAAEVRSDVLAHSAHSTVLHVGSTAEAWAALGSLDPGVVLDVELSAEEAAAVLLAVACTATGNFAARVDATVAAVDALCARRPDDLGEGAGDDAAAESAAFWWGPLDRRSAELLAGVASSEHLAAATAADRRDQGGFSACGGVDDAGVVPGCDGGCGAAAVLAVALVISDRRFDVRAPLEVPLGALVDAAAELGDLVAGGELGDAQLGVWWVSAAVCCSLVDAGVDPDAAAASFGVRRVCDLPDECFDECLAWWDPYRRAAPGVPRPVLDAFLTLGTDGGRRGRAALWEVLELTSPALGVEVAAALYSDTAPTWAVEVAGDFCIAAAGVWGHSWSPEGLSSAFATHPALAAEVCAAAPQVAATLPNLPEVIVEASLRTVGFVPWVSGDPTRLLGLVTVEVDHLLAGHCPPGEVPPGWVGDLWATVWSLMGSFRGTAADLVAVAAELTPGAPGGR